MANNPFDQFDATMPASSMPGAASPANPFDQFDAQTTPQATRPTPFDSAVQAQVQAFHDQDVNPQQPSLAHRILDPIQNFGNAEAHHLASVPIGLTQLAANAASKIADLALPVNSQERQQDDATAQRINQNIAKREASYQANVPTNKSSLAGASVGEIIPWLSGVGEAGALSKLPEGASILQKIGLLAKNGALLGGKQALVQPVTDGGNNYAASKGAQVGEGMIAGAITGPVATGAVRGLQALGSATKGVLWDPLLNQKSLLAGAINHFSQGGNVTFTPSTVPGVQSTLAEGTGNAGIAQLQRTLQNAAASSQGGVNAFANRVAENNNARLAYLHDAVGTPQTIADLQAARDQGTHGLYGLAGIIDQQQAKDAGNVIQNINQAEASRAAQQAERLRANGRLIPGYQDAAEQAATQVEGSAPQYALQPNPAIQSLMSRPAFQTAVTRAKTLLANQGRPGVNPLMSVDGLQAVKFALDEMANADPSSSLGKFGKQAVLGIKNELMGATNNLSPAFQAANSEYARLSQPINAAMTGQAIVNRGLDAAGGNTLLPGAFGRAVSNADRIAQQQTGNVNATAQNTLTAQQWNALQNVRNDLVRSQIPGNAGRSVGSNTVQNLASQGALTNFANALGAPGLANNAFAQRVTRPIDAFYNMFGIREELREKLTNAVLNPESPEAQAILSSPLIGASNQLGPKTQNALNLLKLLAPSYPLNRSRQEQQRASGR